MSKERLQKVMAEAGIASRRHCEQMIREGLVKVNGQVVTKLPVLVDPQQDRIVASGRRLKFEPKVYYLQNKPKKVVCTNYDPQGRRRAVDLLSGVKERVYPVGRLDADSKGLLILTNDGELANLLTHPRYGVVKTYVAQIKGRIAGEDLAKLKKGMYLAEGRASAEQVKILRRGPKRSLLEISLREGRNRQIRRMLLRLGHPVHQLTRVGIGRLTLRGLGLGKYRPLTDAEVKSLRRSVQSAQKKGSGKLVNRSQKKKSSSNLGKN
jgi:23S rRNA pseudouridine2605 synthase